MKSKRLEKLKRQILPSRGREEPAVSTSGVSLAEALPGTVLSSEQGQCRLVSRCIESVDPLWSETAQNYLKALSGLSGYCNPLDLSPPLHRLMDIPPEGIVFFDLESCGFRNSVVFLIGMLFCEKGRFVGRQLFARSVEEEEAILEECLNCLSGVSTLVTYNGIRFDLPLLRDRLGKWGLGPLPTFAHLDLLPIVRRRWKKRLPNCSLRTVERWILGLNRSGDIPSSRVGSVYEKFAATGNAAGLPGLFRHNLFDLVSLAELVTCLLTGFEPNVE